MIELKSATLGLAMCAFAGGSALAMPMHDHAKMSANDMKMMESCHAMSHDAMMKDKACMRLMKAHPDMTKGDDAMMKKDGGMKK